MARHFIHTLLTAIECDVTVAGIPLFEKDGIEGGGGSKKGNAE